MEHGTDANARAEGGLFQIAQGASISRASPPFRLNCGADDVFKTAQTGRVRIRYREHRQKYAGLFSTRRIMHPIEDKPMKRAAFLAIAIVAAACSQQPSPNPLAPAALGGGTAVMPSTVHFTAPFTATAMCSADIGRIQFTGMIEGT